MDPLNQVTLPLGWVCKDKNCYLKKVTNPPSRGNKWIRGFGKTFTTYRVIQNGWMGGWIVDVDRLEGHYLFGGAPFPSAIAAMVATDIELASTN